MSGPTKYLLVSLPTSIAQSGHPDEALTALRSTVSTDYGTVYPFPIPNFKIGTLDALVQQADELAKLESASEGVVSKVGDSLWNLLEGDESKISQQKTVNAKPVDQYLRTFSWNRVKYRADKPIGELIDSLQKEIASIDNDIKGKYNQYNQVKTNLTALERRQTGNLATKSLTPIVDPSIMIQDSEYLETHLVAVPNPQVKSFLKSYETLVPMVVPRSSTQITSDGEFTLFAVTTFKKHGQEFVHKCREMKWTPRDYKVKEGGREEEQRDLDRVKRDERKIWGEALRLGGTGWGESVMVWIHVFALRVFVETVLRYGLPLEFTCGLVKTTPKLAKKAKYSLDAAYSYLGGNAFGRDKKGRVTTKDDSAMSQEMAAAGHVGDGGEYSAYVFYEFDIN
ncbi:MAG: Vacuolar ATP synthase subunit C [Sclerophora amabilis]|nr:MAG: Vacuolar ATP synthase subunit C [Sclerophora amabilis]